jgi:hypothetical protein
VVLQYRERSVGVRLAEYCVAVWYWNTESGLSVWSWRCVVERCGILVKRAVSLCSWRCIVWRCRIVVQRAVCQCAAGDVLCSGVVLWYRERSVSVQLVVYCVPVLYFGTESGLSVHHFRLSV